MCVGADKAENFLASDRGILFKSDARNQNPQISNFESQGSSTSRSSPYNTSLKNSRVYYQDIKAARSNSNKKDRRDAADDNNSHRDSVDSGYGSVPKTPKQSSRLQPSRNSQYQDERDSHLLQQQQHRLKVSTNLQDETDLGLQRGKDRYLSHESLKSSSPGIGATNKRNNTR